MRLAAAEVGLQLDDRIASLAGQAASTACVSSRRRPSVRNVRRKNSVGCLYSSDAFSLIDLPEVGRELGLLVAAGGHVRVRRDDFPPRLQAALRLALGRLERTSCASPERRCSSNMTRIRSMRIWPTSVAASAAETAFSSRSIESSARMASLLLNCSLCAQLVADVPQLADEAAFGVAEHVRGRRRSTGPTCTPEQDLRIVEIGGLWPWLAGRVRVVVRQGGLPVVAEVRLQFAFDKGAQAGCQKVQSFADTFTV